MPTDTPAVEPYDLSPKDAAELLGVHDETIKRWASSGKLPAFRTPGGWWRFRRSDVLALTTTDPGQVA